VRCDSWKSSRNPYTPCGGFDPFERHAVHAGRFDPLGYHLEPGYRWPPEKSLKKFKGTIRANTRHPGQSLAAIVTDLNRTLRGGFEYFKHSHRSTFPAWTNGSGCGFVVSCAAGKDEGGEGEAVILSAAQRLLCPAAALLLGSRRQCSTLSEVSHRPEGRMREIRPSGSEGDRPIRPSYPYNLVPPVQ
jgi:group II intron maturase